MKNIINLALFIFLIELILLFFCDAFFLPQIIVAFVASIASSLALYHLNFYNKKSPLLFLNLGFYRHFSFILLKNFLYSFDLLTSIAFDRNKLKPLVYRIELANSQIEKSILIATINLSLGLLLVENKGDVFVIHALNEKYFDDLNISRLAKQVHLIDEDEIV